MPNGDATNTCVLGNRNEANLQSLVHDLEAEKVTRKSSDDAQWSTINRIANRLPTWATIVIGLLTATIGLLGGLAV